MKEGKLYYSITEVSKELDIKPTVLRFWEKEFDCITPRKNKQGYRCYTASDIELLRRIKYLTKECGFTLSGAREQLKNKNQIDPKAQLVDNLKEVRSFLVKLKEEL